MKGALNKERLSWLRLYRSENVGPVTFRRLISKYKTAEKALDILPELGLRGGRKNPIRIYSESEACKEIEAVQKLGGRFCLSCDEDYPSDLSFIDDAPAVLTLLGQGKINQSQPVIGIVGARNASLNGRRFTEKLAKELNAHGIVVASGLARGIDTAAHKGSLNSTIGTWAVVAGGADIVYPQENTQLYESIKEHGLIISENILGTQPKAQHFPRRNRIVSGLSKGIIVVEASIRSGSLITARLAAEQGRDVFAVPGFPEDPRAAGPNKLLKDGAILLETVDDVLNQLISSKIAPSNSQPSSMLFDPMVEQDCFEGCVEEFSELEINSELDPEKVASMLSHLPIAVDEIVRACHVSVSGVQSVLLDLEIAGRLQRLPGNRVGLVNKEL